jgi:hypothetical protein
MLAFSALTWFKIKCEWHVPGSVQLPVQSVPTTTNVVSSNPAYGEVYSIQLYVIKFSVTCEIPFFVWLSRHCLLFSLFYNVIFKTLNIARCFACMGIVNEKKILQINLVRGIIYDENIHNTKYIHSLSLHHKGIVRHFQTHSLYTEKLPINLILVFFICITIRVDCFTITYHIHVLVKSTITVTTTASW